MRYEFQIFASIVISNNTDEVASFRERLLLTIMCVCEQKLSIFIGFDIARRQWPWDVMILATRCLILSVRCVQRCDPTLILNRAIIAIPTMERVNIHCYELTSNDVRSRKRLVVMKYKYWNSHKR